MGGIRFHYSSRASFHQTSVRARLQRLARDEHSDLSAAKSCRSSAGKPLPYAVGSRAPAPSKPGVPSTRGFRVLGWKPGVGLLGRSAAERAKKLTRTQRLYPALCCAKERGTRFYREGTEMWLGTWLQLCGEKLSLGSKRVPRSFAQQRAGYRR